MHITGEHSPIQLPERRWMLPRFLQVGDADLEAPLWRAQPMDGESQQSNASVAVPAGSGLPNSHRHSIFGPSACHTSAT